MNDASHCTGGYLLAPASPCSLLEKLAALVPLPRVHLVRYGGCLAPHSHLRGVIRPTPRQQGMDGEETQTRTPYWPWARLLGRVFGLEMATCPFCRRGTLRIIAVITQESVEFIPIKSLVATGSSAPGSCAGHSRVPSPDRGRLLSPGGSGL